MVKINPLAGCGKKRQASPRFGELSKRQESLIFKLLPSKAKVMDLINQYEDAKRLPFGFETPPERKERECQSESIEAKMLQAVKAPDFKTADAQNLLMLLYQGRDKLVHQLPEKIFDAILRKATTVPSRQEEALPEPLQKRMKNALPGQKKGILVVTPQELAALTGPGGKTIGVG